MSKGSFDILWTTVEKVTVTEITPFKLMPYYIVRLHVQVGYQNICYDSENRILGLKVLQRT